MPEEQRNRAVGQKYETVFCIFLVLLAFLSRENAHMVYPQALYLLFLLLTLNLAAGVSLRLWPSREWLSAAIIMANSAVVTTILAYSGGHESNLWVLYLLPIFTACLLLCGRAAVWVTGGTLAFTIFFYATAVPVWDAAAAFGLGLKLGILLFAAAVLNRIAVKNREARCALAEREGALESLESELTGVESDLRRSEKLAAAGMISSGVSHDLQTPLTVILGTTQVVLSKTEFPERFRPDVERIARAAMTCTRIVATMLDLASREENETGLCDVSRLIEDTLGMFESSLRLRRIAINKSIERSLPPVAGRANEIQRLLLNLLSNAMDAMPRGGTLSVRAEAAGPLAGAQQPLIKITVEDTGEGISEEALPGLFEAFKTTKAPGKGTGLGLFTCRRIVAGHGGSLHAENKPRGGARFVVSLLAQSAAAGADRPMKEGEHHERKTNTCADR